tara:strand:- start:44 stop:619 length:576 start_codon:yes stop_codon:yes gene_type:complete
MKTYATKSTDELTNPHAWYDLEDWENKEEQIAGLEERWHHLWENVPDVILEIDLDGRISIINQVLPEFTIDEVIGTSVFEYIPEHQHSAMRSAMTHVLETGDLYQYEIPAFTNNRTTWWSNRIAPIDQNGQTVGFLIIASNVTELKEREQELQIQNAKLNDLVRKQAKFEKRIEKLEKENTRLKTDARKAK